MPKRKYRGQSWRTSNKRYRPVKKRKISKKKNNYKFNYSFNVLKLFARLPRNFKKALFLFVGGITVLGIIFIIGFTAWLSSNLPTPDGLMEREVAQSTKILDRTGEEILYEIHGAEQRTTVKLDEIPDYIKWATIAIEDKNFYEHKGISLWGIFRGVVWRKIRGLPAQGGSTLTQQLVKNAILTNERTIIRKVKEWILAYRIEKKYSKDEILQMYLNEIPYGSTAYGVEAASRRYFGKGAKDITLAEAAILAALPQAPTRYSPYGSNRDVLLGRQQYILKLMVEQGFITQEQANEAQKQVLDFKRQATDIRSPHFVMYVKEMLAERYGEKMVEQGGLKITTTLDLYKQEIAEEVIAELGDLNAEKYNAGNAALLSLDPKTGEILAMVGSRDYFNDEIDGQVNIVTSSRQPGSSIKPLVYATAFIKGYTPDTMLYDVFTNFSEDEEEPYEPVNYDEKEHGPVSIRKALAGSLNIPAVKTLYLAGVRDVTDLSMDFGYTTLTDPDRYGLSLVLGGADVKMIEHVNAFSVFAREGIYHPTLAILKVEDSHGNVLDEFETEEKKVIDARIARLINNILSDNDARAYAFGLNNWLTLGNRPVAAKTGTTNDYRDAWTIGYTPSLVTGVWVGNNDYTAMKPGAAGGRVAAPIWNEYMAKVLGDTPVEQFRVPEIEKTGIPILDGETGLETVVRIDKTSGLLATENTPESQIIEKTFIQPHSILHYINKDDPRSGEPPADPKDDAQYELWEEGIAKWLEKEGYATSTPPTEEDTLHTKENQPKVKIVSPGNNQTIMEPFLNAGIDATAPRGINRAEYYINDNLFYTNTSYPFDMAKRIDFLPNGFQNLKVKVCDDVDNCTTEETEFNLVLEENNNHNDILGRITSPRGGLAVSNIDFPLLIEVNTNEPSLVARVDIYYTREGQTDPLLASVIQPVDTNNVRGAWNNIPESGVYKLHAELVSWTKEKTQTDPVTIIINNINQDKQEG